LSTAAVACEELGWLGLLLPALLRQVRRAAAAVIVGGAWALWHLPLFYIAGSLQSAIPFWLFAINIIAACLIYTWLFLRSAGSLVPSVSLYTFQDVSLAVAPMWWPVASNGGAFWYAYFGIVVLAGLVAGGVLQARATSRHEPRPDPLIFSWQAGREVRPEGRPIARLAADGPVASRHMTSRCCENMYNVTAAQRATVRDSY
jgi:hypothetical protein